MILIKVVTIKIKDFFKIVSLTKVLFTQYKFNSLMIEVISLLDLGNFSNLITLMKKIYKFKNDFNF